MRRKLHSVCQLVCDFRLGVPSMNDGCWCEQTRLTGRSRFQVPLAQARKRGGGRKWSGEEPRHKPQRISRLAGLSSITYPTPEILRRMRQQQHEHNELTANEHQQASFLLLHPSQRPPPPTRLFDAVEQAATAATRSRRRSVEPQIGQVIWRKRRGPPRTPRRRTTVSAHAVAGGRHVQMDTTEAKRRPQRRQEEHRRDERASSGLGVVRMTHVVNFSYSDESRLLRLPCCQHHQHESNRSSSACCKSSRNIMSKLTAQQAPGTARPPWLP
ncbi:hypothetical protein IWX90DRAFT_86304 [Phyllosticta citrichinensis]|uniref:Uncharacterized protein n=1 Tax=Phyllosticta citrichinensis TaxID=1130410 RepID=A0ABR1XFB8_9PEZI